MKIAIYHNLPNGGALRILDQMCSSLIKKGHSVHVFSIGEQKFYHSKVKVETTHINVAPWKGFFQRNFWILTVLKKIHKKLSVIINKSNFDLIIFHHDYFTKSPYLMRYVNTKSIYICHEPQREFYESYKIHTSSFKERIANGLRLYIKYTDERNVKKAGLIIANSQYSQKVISRIYGVDSVLLYPSVDTRVFKPTSRKNNSILIVGGINKVKDPYFIVEALKPLLGKIRLIFVGKGTTREVELLKKVAGDKYKHINIVQNISDSKLVNLYSSARVLCIGAHYEPFGLSSIEAQACGTAVVAVNEGGVSETISDGATGYLSSRDCNKFRQCVTKAIKNTNMSQACIKNAFRWDLEKWEISFNNIISLYETINS